MADANVWKPLFHKLISLRLSGNGSYIVDHPNWSSFLPRGLQELSLHSIHCSAQLVHTVTSCSPELTTITITSARHSLSSSWSDLLQGLPNLQHVSLDHSSSKGDIFWRCIGVLSSLPSLKSLSLWTEEESPPGTAVSLSQFHTLREFNYYGVYSIFDQLWKLQDTSYLATVDISLDLPVWAPADEPFDRIVASLSPYTTTLRLYIGRYELREIGDNQETIDLTALSQFSSLTHLDLDLGQPLFVSDDELCALLSAWPSLQYCSLDFFSLTKQAPQLTFAVLPGIAHACPLLAYLALTLTALGKPHLDAGPYFVHLVDLSLCIADEVKHFRACARFLTQLTPDFCSIGVYHACSYEAPTEKGHASNSSCKRSVAQLKESLNAFRTMKPWYERLAVRCRGGNQGK